MIPINRRRSDPGFFAKECGDTVLSQISGFACLVIFWDLVSPVISSVPVLAGQLKYKFTGTASVDEAFNAVVE